jgi:hypothetical protein
MGNRITHPKYGTLGSIKMSNGLTDVFLATLIVSGSHLASKPNEIYFVLWIAMHDQSVLGVGTVGFDLSELPWNFENFEQEKSFLLGVIEDAHKELGGGIFEFGTHPEFLRGDLEQLRMLVLNLDLIDAKAKKKQKIRKTFLYEGSTTETAASRLESQFICELEKFPVHSKCSTHNVFVSEFGCFICNNF